MTFYRVDYRCQGESKGFTFHTSHADAYKTIQAAVKKGTADALEDGGSDIDRIEVFPDRPGILRALNRYAGHPDNG